MTSTFEHKYDIDDTVYIRFKGEILEMKVSGIIYRKEKETVVTEGVDYWLTGKVSTVFSEDSIYATKEEIKI